MITKPYLVRSVNSQLLAAVVRH